MKKSHFKHVKNMQFLTLAIGGRLFCKSSSDLQKQTHRSLHLAANMFGLLECVELFQPTRIGSPNQALIASV